MFGLTAKPKNLKDFVSRNVRDLTQLLQSKEVFIQAEAHRARGSRGGDLRISVNSGDSDLIWLINSGRSDQAVVSQFWTLCEADSPKLRRGKRLKNLSNGALFH